MARLGAISFLGPQVLGFRCVPPTPPRILRALGAPYLCPLCTWLSPPATLSQLQQCLLLREEMERTDYPAFLGAMVVALLAESTWVPPLFPGLELLPLGSPPSSQLVLCLSLSYTFLP